MQEGGLVDIGRLSVLLFPSQARQRNRNLAMIIQSAHRIFVVSSLTSDNQLIKGASAWTYPIKFCDLFKHSDLCTDIAADQNLSLTMFLLYLSSTEHCPKVLYISSRPNIA